MRSFSRFGAVCCGMALCAVSVTADAGMTRSTAERLMASGKSLTCEYKAGADAGSTGTFYVSKGKIRADFNVSNGSEISTGHMIQSDGWAYIWGGPLDGKQGTKMRIDAAQAAGQKPQGFDPVQEMDMNCRDWKADASRFVIPSEIEFMDLSSFAGGALQVTDTPVPAGAQNSLQNQAASGQLSMQQLKCQACNQEPPGPVRNQCLQIMGCPPDSKPTR